MKVIDLFPSKEAALENCLPVLIPGMKTPAPLPSNERLTIQLSIGKEIMDPNPDKKDAKWLTFSFQIEKNQLALLLGNFNFAAYEDL